jgi:hypothetical protein
MQLDVKTWESQLPYPVDIMAGYHRLKIAERSGSAAKLEKAWQRFEKVCAAHGLDRSVFDEFESVRR